MKRNARCPQPEAVNAEMTRLRANPVRAVRVLAALVLLVGSAAQISASEPPAAGGSAAIETLAPLVKRVKRSVVTIKATTQVLDAYPSAGPGFGFPDGPLPVTRETGGAGVIVDADRGFVLTSGHVASGADAISVLLYDGRRFAARIVVMDEDTDLAILAIDAADLAGGTVDCANDTQPGDFVLAIGNPLGLEFSASFGIVSALHRSWSGVSGHDLIQTDVLLDRGSSGGPLFNLRGEIIGINVARANDAVSERSFGFAVPASAIGGILLRAQKTN